MNIKHALMSILLFAISGAAMAGSRDIREVDVNLNNLSAAGSFVGALNSNDFSQYIGCSLSASGSRYTTTVSCSARDAEGETLVCYSTATSYVRTIASLTNQSYLRFVADANGNCVTVSAGTSSLHTQ